MKRNANLLATFQYVKCLLGGGKKQQKRTLVIALILVELLLIIGAYISYNSKNLDKYIFGASTSSNNLFAVMIEGSNGNYQQSTDNNFPGYEYFYNQTKSGCMSSSGKQIEDSLLYDQDNKKATVKVGQTSMCYLYFDKYKTTTFADQLIDSGKLWQSGLEGDGYRYVGQGVTCSYDNGNYVDVANNQDTTPTCPILYNYTRTNVSSGATSNYTYKTSCPSNTSSYTYSCTELQGTIINAVIPNNFICFGTSDKTKCTANQDKYMYRIIGVFADSSGNNHAKLIKYKQLRYKYAWNADSETDVSWENSDMYKGLNGPEFLTNARYDYLQDTAWNNRIENWTWSAVNTKSWEDRTNNPNYYYSTTKGIYLNEMHKASSETLCKNIDESAINCNSGEWTTPSAKIGLMNASDYQMSLGSSSLSLTGTSSSTLKTGWMHQSNNDTSKSTWEWTLARIGESYGYFLAWYVDIDGCVNSNDVLYEYGVRPVFYLTKNVTALGAGSLENPFIITDDMGTTSTLLKLSLSASGSTLTTTITKRTGNLNKYCINNKASINDCEWKSVTSTTISYNMTSEGTYYAHVIDDAGYIAHSSYTYKKAIPLTEHLIASGNLWQSGLEGDGYRYTGTGVTCSYDSGNYIGVANNQYTTPTCPTLYNYTRTTIASGATDNYTYSTYCPKGNSSYTYSCTELQGTIFNTVIPNNFICFGTIDKSECTANQDKYMYRVLGVFSDANGDNHVKLIKYKQLGSKYAWNSDETVDVSLDNSELYEGLNGNYFLTNTTYDYLQSAKWSNRIENWTWSAVNTKTNTNNGPYYYDITTQQIYLHEMNRIGKSSTVGEWTNPVAKIGLMYASDYQMSLGASALELTGSSYSTLQTGWMHQSNNDTTKSTDEWTISRYGAGSGGNVTTLVWGVRGDGYVDYTDVFYDFGARPVFYLTSDVKITADGDGSLENPFIIEN